MLGDLQLGYLGVEVPDVAGLSGFFADVVGLAPGDDPGTWRNDSKARRVIVAEGPSADATFVGFEAEIRFYHCNPRHHSLALARAPFDLPQRLHHFMVEVSDRDDVGYAFDRAWNAGCVIASGLGHHPNDRMFSFYVASPAGFQVEVGHGARQVTEGWDENRRYDRISTWGHQPLQPPDPASAHA